MSVLPSKVYSLYVCPTKEPTCPVSRKAMVRMSCRMDGWVGRHCRMSHTAACRSRLGRRRSTCHACQEQQNVMMSQSENLTVSRQVVSLEWRLRPTTPQRPDGYTVRCLPTPGPHGVSGDNVQLVEVLGGSTADMLHVG